ncbi:hypothetical protein [Isoptericola variabilis]|uniref:Uncharacterized protein n=1 Tax=Isoptericola variabilis (strain 225) TaxID=743718 RepID=F6FUS7_ISOV2|nr:hypothetical protein [Isoptericola variabilis]AEG43338.1 hypothetical protein Isova_0543 [Isoptericola variabilis 225]
MSGQRTGGSRPSYLSPDYRSPGDRVHRRPSAAVLRRRRRVVAGLALGVVLLVAVLTAFVWPGFARSDDPTPAATVTAPPPTPTVEPTGRPENQTALLTALPDTVLQLALRAVEPRADWEDERDAVEAWTLAYADGPDANAAGAAVVRLVVGQWGDERTAGGVLDDLLADAGEATMSGDVTVDGESAGTYAVTPGAEDGTAVVTWRNGTVVLQATGPAGLVEDFYSAFPL